jgi:hypothetical protein
VRKLCSTLVAYFLQFSTSWVRCVRHLIYCLYVNQAVPYSSVAEAPDTPLLIENLSNDKAIVIFWFAAALVEEIGKTDSSSMKQLSEILCESDYHLVADPLTRHKFHRRIVPNVTDVVPLIEKYITNSAITLDVKGRQEAMRCFQVRMVFFII